MVHEAHARLLCPQIKSSSTVGGCSESFVADITLSSSWKSKAVELWLIEDSLVLVTESESQQMPTKQSKAIEHDFESTGAAGLTRSPAGCGVMAADFTALLVKHWKSLSLIQVHRSLVPEVESRIYCLPIKKDRSYALGKGKDPSCRSSLFGPPHSARCWS
jgi:hypothetical protein